MKHQDVQLLRVNYTNGLLYNSRTHLQGHVPIYRLPDALLDISSPLSEPLGSFHKKQAMCLSTVMLSHLRMVGTGMVGCLHNPRLVVSWGPLCS